MPSVEELRPVAAALAGWLPKAGLSGAGVRVEPLGEGHSNLTFRVRAGRRRRTCCAARRPDRCCRPRTTWCASTACCRCSAAPSNRSASQRVVALCEDTAVIGAPFYVMAEVPGLVIRRRAAGPRSPTPLRSTRSGSTCVDVARRDPPRRAGSRSSTPGSGRPGGYLARQLDRWVGQREGDPARGRRSRRAGPRAARLRRRAGLAARPPARRSPAPALVHGDFKLDNVIVDRRGPDVPPRVAAVVDWEMATVGDPRADLGYLLSFWPEPGEPCRSVQLVATGPGFPRRVELVDRWAIATVARPRRPRLVRDAGDLEAGDPARGVVPPLAGRHGRRPVLRDPGRRRAGAAAPGQGRPAVPELRGLVVDWGGVMTDDLGARDAQVG